MDETKLFLEHESTMFPEMSPVYKRIGELIDKKLYYQLSLQLVDLLKTPFFLANDSLMRIYANVVVRIQNKLDPFCLAFFATEAVNQIEVQEFKTSFIDKIQPAIKHSPEALFLIEVTDIKIDFLTTDFNFVDEHLHETSQTLSKHLQDFKNPTKAYFYRVRMEFYKHYNMSTEFYETALSYLRYEDIESLRPNDRLILGTDICKAALVGKIYAPEKLINHPIITDLQQTAEKWLYVALKAMNECDIEKFEAALFNDQENENDFANKNSDILMQKIRKVVFLRICANKVAQKQNVVSLAEISNHCKLPEKDVEEMVLDLMCEDLVRGRIDSISRTLQMAWIKPIVGGNSELTRLRSGIEKWAIKSTIK